MGNINTYLKWRGDLTFTERSFCEADNLALAILSYLNFSQIVDSGEQEISIKSAYEKYHLLGWELPFQCGLYEELFRNLAMSRRFGNARLSFYREIFSEESTTQFAAVQIALEDGSFYLAFRGTDDSIIGWQEDFQMGSAVIPAQREAVRYLNEVMCPGKIYRIGGHSKGGNLSLYSALHCREELKGSIFEVYNNDGPGLSSDIVEQERFAQVEKKLFWIIPEYSVIGTLFPYRFFLNLLYSFFASNLRFL